MAAEHDEDESRGKAFWAAVAFGGLAVAVAVVIGIVTLTGPEDPITVNKLADDPEAHVGEQVTVSGEVGRVLDEPGGFTIGADQDQPVIVLPERGADVPSDLVEGRSVSVTGTVEMAARGLAEQQDLLFEGGAGSDLVLEVLGQSGDNAALLATSVRPVDAQ